METLKFEDISNFEFKKEIAGTHGHGEHKSIFMVCNTTDPINKFEVVDHGKTVNIFIDLEKAIEQYNNI